MYASKHVVFVGPGELPARLEGLSPGGASTPPVEPGAPRLLSFFESAADAERMAIRLLRHKLGVVVAGPEQPPADASWDQAKVVEHHGGFWHVTLAHRARQRLDLAAITELISIDWRAFPEHADKALLFRSSEHERPVFLRACVLVTGLGARLPRGPLDAFLEACGQHLRQEARIRHRRLTASAFGAPTLLGDLLPLAMGVIDSIDTHPGELPGRPRW